MAFRSLVVTTLLLGTGAAASESPWLKGQTHLHSANSGDSNTPPEFEVANEAVDSNNEGDATTPSTERLWDQVLDAGGRIYGVASDDAHHYADADLS